MDNPQPYQPLSHALHPPSTNARSLYPQTIHHQYSTHPHQSIHPLSTQKQPLQNSSRISGHEEEEEEEEEDDDEDEGIVEDQLNQNDPDPHGSNSSSPRPSGYILHPFTSPFSNIVPLKLAPEIINPHSLVLLRIPQHPQFRNVVPVVRGVQRIGVHELVLPNMKHSTNTHPSQPSQVLPQQLLHRLLDLLVIQTLTLKTNNTMTFNGVS